MREVKSTMNKIKNMCKERNRKSEICLIGLRGIGQIFNSDVEILLIKKDVERESN